MNYVTSRKGWQLFAAMVCFSLLFALVVLWTRSADATPKERTISIYNIHTKETLTVVYKRGGRYIPSAMKKINYIMGDWRRKEATKMDPKLIDLMWELHTELGSRKPIYLISGYRSLKTNNFLRKTRGGQATRSRHILGKAADVHFPDISARALRNSAMIRQRGGVGYYPTSAIPFVHLDTGRVRHWPRMGRYELAALFPKGRTRHIPRDGRRITVRDYKVAMARLSTTRKNAALLALKRANSRKKATQLASLVPRGLTRKGKRVRPAFNPIDRKIVKRKEKFDRKGLLRLASLTPNKGIVSNNGNGSRKMIDSGARNNWVSAPSYDDDHADELSYSPFRVLPLMRDISVSYDTKLIPLVAPEHHKAFYLFGEPTEESILRFRPGLQYAQMLWAREFHGKAVNSILRRKAPSKPKKRQNTQANPKYPKYHLRDLQKRVVRGSVVAGN